MIINYRSMNKDVYILGIESSCDETAAAVFHNDLMLSNVIASQDIHKLYGGVVPELASRAHQQKIILVVDAALKEAKVSKNDLSAVAFTRGPGLIGALLVGVSFAKSMALALEIPLIEVNHMQAHVLAHFIQRNGNEKLRMQNAELNPKSEIRNPKFPFLCLTVSGGHTQIVLVKDYLDMQIIGETLDDAAGEAFDKGAKIMGLPYPGGPLIDELAKKGNPNAYKFPHPYVERLNFSFSGLKTSMLYFIRDNMKNDSLFVEKNKADICASLQRTIIEVLIDKLQLAAMQHGIKEIAIAGGVSANSGLRSALSAMKEKEGWNVYIPDFEFCTDNAAMIAIAGYYKYLVKDFADQSVTPLARMEF